MTVFRHHQKKEWVTVLRTRKHLFNHYHLGFIFIIPWFDEVEGYLTNVQFMRGCM